MRNKSDPALRSGPATRIGVASLLLLAGLSATSLSAQDTTGVQRGPWVVAYSAGVPAHASGIEPELFTLGVQATRIERDAMGVELAVGTMPRAWALGLLPLGARAGLALPVALTDNVLVVPTGGASLIAVAETGGGSASPGLNLGAAALAFGDGSTGVRAGFTWHWFGGRSRGVGLLEVGIARR